MRQSWIFFLLLICFVLADFLFNRNQREIETAAYRKKVEIGHWWSLDANLPIPKRLFVILRVLSSTELYFWFPTRAVQKNFNVYTHLM